MVGGGGTPSEDPITLKKIVSAGQMGVDCYATGGFYDAEKAWCLGWT
jgi:hypothetical protein